MIFTKQQNQRKTPPMALEDSALYYIPTALCKYPFEEQARASHPPHISEKHFNPPICVKYYTNNKQLHESEN